MTRHAPAQTQTPPLPKPIVLTKAEAWARGVRSDVVIEMGTARYRETVNALNPESRKLLMAMASEVVAGQNVVFVDVAAFSQKLCLSPRRIRICLRMLQAARVVGRYRAQIKDGVGGVKVELLMGDGGAV